MHKKHEEKLKQLLINYNHWLLGELAEKRDRNAMMESLMQSFWKRATQIPLNQEVKK